MDLITVRCGSPGGAQTFAAEADFVARYGDHPVLLLAREPAKLVWRSWLPATLWLAPTGGLRVDVDGVAEHVGADAPMLTAHGESVSAGALGTPAAPWVFGLVLPATLRLALGAEPPTVRLDGAVEIAAALTRIALRADPRAAPLTTIEDDLDCLSTALRRELRQFLVLVDRCPGQSAQRRAALFRRLLRARRRLLAEEGVDVPLRRLAVDAALSPSHFLRVFRQVFGMTPHELATAHRVDLARRLVLRTALPLAEVGSRLGMPNRSAFSQFFRHHFGVAASRMRAAHGDTAATVPRPSRWIAGSVPA